MTDEALNLALRERLQSRITDINLLDDLLRRAVGVRLFDEYATDQMAKNKAIRNVVDGLSDEGTLDLFLRQVALASPYLPELRAWIADKFPGTHEAIADAPIIEFQTAGQKPTRVASPQGGLQRYVRPELGPVNVRPWFAGGLDAARRVCRVEADNNALGTGFLIGKDLALTNWHVVRRYIAANATDALSCRFDYAADASGAVSDGEKVELASHGILAWSPAAATEAPDIAGLPPLGPDALDFAVLKLKQEPGAQRGWFDLLADPPQIKLGAPILIIQHPGAASLKLALDTNAVLAPFPPVYRLRYATNTDFGSSGSPVLTMDWRLIALHHFGDPSSTKPEYNEGVPTVLIRDRLLALGGVALASPA